MSENGTLPLPLPPRDVRLGCTLRTACIIEKDAALAEGGRGGVALRGRADWSAVATAAAVLLAVVVFVAALSTMVVSYVGLEHKLCAQEERLAELLPLLGLDKLLHEAQVEPADVGPPIGAARQADSRSPSEARRRTARSASSGSLEAVAAQVAGQYSAHLEPLSPDRSRTLNASNRDGELNGHLISAGLGYLEWEQIQHTGLINGRPTNSYQLSLLQQKWLLVNESGLYYVYSQVTFWGQRLNLHSLRQRSNLLQRIVVSKDKLAKHRRRHISTETTLAEGLVTQYSSRCRDGNWQECPMDSVHTGGVFHLTAGSLVGVKVNSIAHIAQHREKTFFGMFLLRRD